ncbi:TAXI family TRAP transporter solute-binding subunit [Jeotgalibacillus marinus]|uniref:TAXI family TRAP transporter solute-binding subunit n=1 Tax=Jeotgalibacillus marinus TaxID=86667 RepID=A0ABV3Q748_9BACL
MKKFKLVMLASLLVVLSACSPGGGTGDGNQFITIATASTGGTYYPIGVGLGNLWSQELKEEGINASGQSSAGSIENIDLMKEGEAHFSILQGLMTDQAYNGEGSFEGKAYEDLRTISMIWPNVEHFVLKDSEIETGTIADIEGTSFSVGPQASGTEQSTLVIMEGLGLTKDHITPEYLGYDDTISAMRDGRLDGGSLPAGVPVAAITDMYASNVGASVLEVSDEQFEQITDISNAWYQYTIPAETYPNQTEDIETIAQPNILVATIDLDEETVYQLTKTLFENLDFMYDVHSSAKEMTLETALDGLPAPLHAGAYKYFEEVGMDIPEELIPPEAK